MRNLIVVFCVSALMCAGALIAEPASDYSHFWPQWRGPEMSGLAPHGNPPVEWSESQNVKWKVEIPGKGSASPIIWKDTIFILSAVPTGEKVEVEPPPPDATRRRRGTSADQVQRFTVFALSREDGRILWERSLREELPHEGTHPTGTWASSSPVTDGEHVYAFFGSRGLYCLTMDGTVLWEKDLGDMQTRNGFGEGSTPFLFRDRLIVTWDHEGQSFIVALSKKTGEEIWRVNRDEITSWATPVVVEHDGVTQVIANATKRVRSYNFEDGTLLWECEGMTDNVIPTPIISEGVAYVTSGFRGNALLAIRLSGAQNNITGTENIVWSHDKHTPYVPTPLLFKNTLYFLSRNSGIVSSFDARTGSAFFGPERLENIGDVYASPVGAAGRIYITDRDGNTAVLAHGPQLNILGVNSLEDGFDASPAIVGNELYLRGTKYLYRISEK
ncbi:MAG TPA: PQQ-binding-like beta-propeller repeat protein [Acidobacteriota bacterium]|nr:PQQ-binding-like beta-propeller repeat protein [Acidobacteriota bacterium]